MGSPRFHSRLYFIVFACLVMGALLAACGSSTTSTTTTTATPTTSTVNGQVATATATDLSLIQEMTFVGTPTAKIVSGTTFEVTGKIKNGDDKQHDIHIQAMLLDASGKVIATTTSYNVDNVPGNATVSFTVQGTTPQPTWSSVQVKVVKVTENINGSGAD